MWLFIIHKLIKMPDLICHSRRMTDLFHNLKAVWKSITRNWYSSPSSTPLIVTIIIITTTIIITVAFDHGPLFAVLA